jgi:hypothetical protein
VEKANKRTIKNNAGQKKEMSHPMARPLNKILNRPTSALATATVALALTFLQLKVGLEGFAP